MIKPTDFSKHLSEYLTSYLPSLRNMSKNTIKSYCDTFKLLLTFLRDYKKTKIEQITLKDITADLTNEFFSWLQDERNNSISTVNQRIAAIHSFFRYVQAESPEYIASYQKIIAIPFKKKTKPLVNYLTIEDMKLILEQPDTETPSGRRDLVLLSLLYDTGARVQELADLKVRDVRLEAPAKIKLFGKGRKSREVPLMNKTAALLKNYLEERNLQRNGRLDFPLFFNNRFTKLTRAGIAYILDKHFNKAKSLSPNVMPDSISPHTLRHSKAMHLLQANVNLAYIRDILGHSDISTTEIYAKADTEMKREALEKVLEDSIPASVPAWASDNNLLSWLKGFDKSLK
jgi:site-specific recombinase XerD